MENICSSCKRPNQYSQQRCTYCGALLPGHERESICPTCSVSLNIDAKYCPNCGDRIGLRRQVEETLAEGGSGSQLALRYRTLQNLSTRRQCSECGALREASAEICPSCGARHSRLVDPRVCSFWEFPEETRQEIAVAMQAEIAAGRSCEQAAARIFDEAGQPFFAEYIQYYDMLGDMLRADAVNYTNPDWHRTKPADDANPFTGKS